MVSYTNFQFPGSAYIPTSQLLAYSPNLWLNQGLAAKNLGLLHHFSSQGAGTMPAAVYIPGLGQATSEHSPSKYIGLDSHSPAFFPFKVRIQVSY